MPDLFGLDIAGIINGAMAQAGGLQSGTLTKKTYGARQAGQLTGGRVASDAPSSFQGYLEGGQVRIPGTRLTASGEFITILGASVSPAAVPAVNDQVVLEGKTFELVELMARDPAAATYMFRVAAKSNAGSS